MRVPVASLEGRLSEYCFQTKNNVRRTPFVLSRILWKAIGFLSFYRVTVRNARFVPAHGPVLFVGLHRNGAMDGVPYLAVAPRAVALVSAQLHRSRIGRLIFPGIPVSRAKDRARGIETDNDESLERCVAHLAQDGELLVLPEGTSTLGPRHLPFKRGAARIARRAMERGVVLTVIPVALHYESAWEWQSCVEAVVGQPIQLRADSVGNVATIQDKISRALEAIGINVASEQELRFIEMLAYAATLGSGRSYSDCLKRLESGVSPSLRQASADLLEAAARAGLLRHQGVPLVPIGSPVPYLIFWLLLAPFVLVPALINLPAFVAGSVAAKRMPDDRNVVAFWRAAFGIPVAVLWAALTTAMLSLTVGIEWAAAYLASSLAMVRFYYRFRKLSVALFNFFRAPSFRPCLLAFRKTLLETLA